MFSLTNATEQNKMFNSAQSVRDFFYSKNFSEFTVNNISVSECKVREDGALYIMSLHHSEAIFTFDVAYKLQSDDSFTNKFNS